MSFMAVMAIVSIAAVVAVDTIGAIYNNMISDQRVLKVKVT